MSSAPNPGDEFPEVDKPLPNSSADDFFVKMNRQFRRPRPSEEAVAAALQAIQTLAGETVTGESDAPGDECLLAQGEPCPKCGGLNAESNRFCGFCGTVVDRSQKSPAKPLASPSSSSSHSPAVPSSPTTAGQHIYHHHYHHHYFPGSDSRAAGARSVDATGTASHGLPPIEVVGAELALRQLVEDWTSQLKTSSFDKLAALYCQDAILVRPDATLLRGRSSIRQYLEGAMKAGVSEVKLELTDTRVLGSVACLAGVSQIQPPAVARGQQERTGKFLMLLRYESGSWRILADVWCMNRDPFPAGDDPLAQESDSIAAPKGVQRERIRFTR